MLGTPMGERSPTRPCVWARARRPGRTCRHEHGLLQASPVGLRRGAHFRSIERPFVRHRSAGGNRQAERAPVSPHQSLQDVGPLNPPPSRCSDEYTCDRNILRPKRYRHDPLPSSRRKPRPDKWWAGGWIRLQKMEGDRAGKAGRRVTHRPHRTSDKRRFWAERQVDGEAGAAARGVRSGDGAPVCLRNLTRDIQPKSEAAKVARRRCPLETIKDAGQLWFRYAWSLVANLENGDVGISGGGYADRPAGGRLYPIRDPSFSG